MCKPQKETNNKTPLIYKRHRLEFLLYRMHHISTTDPQLPQQVHPTQWRYFNCEWLATELITAYGKLEYDIDVILFVGQQKQTRAGRSNPMTHHAFIQDYSA